MRGFTTKVGIAFALGTVILLGLVSVVLAQGAAAPQRFTVEYDSYLIDPCGRGLVHIDMSVSVTLVQVVDGNGGYHLAAHEVQTGTATILATGETYPIRLTHQDNVNDQDFTWPPTVDHHIGLVLATVGRPDDRLVIRVLGHWSSDGDVTIVDQAIHCI